MPFHPRDETTIMLLADYRKTYHHRRRWTCKGQRADKQIDICSFAGPLARVFRQNIQLDVFLYSSNTHGYVPLSEAQALPPVAPCKINKIETSCIEREIALPLLKKKYGDDPMTPPWKDVCRCDRTLARCRERGLYTTTGKGGKGVRSLSICSVCV